MVEVLLMRMNRDLRDNAMYHVTARVKRQKWSWFVGGQGDVVRYYPEGHRKISHCIMAIQSGIILSTCDCSEKWSHASVVMDESWVCSPWPIIGDLEYRDHSGMIVTEVKLLKFLTLYRNYFTLEIIQ
jgi:hypothetical protein